ncbi:TPA: base excision DNA repair protein [Staphylococcus aureus]|nr:base excision DNA repair protein [Staphylococcus aureus]
MDISLNFNHYIDLKKSIKNLCLMKKFEPYVTNENYDFIEMPLVVEGNYVLLKIYQETDTLIKLHYQEVLNSNRKSVIQESDIVRISRSILNEALDINSNIKYKYDTFGLTIISDADNYTTLIRTILAQQVSIEQANKLFLLFINTYGEIFELNNKEYTFLNWDKIFSRIYKEQKVLVGTTNNRKQAIITLAELHIKNGLRENVLQVIPSIKGIGAWTVQMFMLFQFPHVAFENIPVADIGLHRAIEKNHDLPHKSIDKSNGESYFQNMKSIDVFKYWYIYMVE